ncbi:type II CAAX prenyl endopeptidase Rce1 family protein [Lederbergia graminis]|uniref:Type II CAAX prenyl endopeptidase Rce1 family protein n=1 Tax=Lederbergia graminis TaxID=735518 RepID=A0ABW0LK41_9BACI
MRKIFSRIFDHERELENSIRNSNVRVIWLLVAIIWVMFGTYAYNELLNRRTVVTEVLFLFITILIIWKNKGLIKTFFYNPFKRVGAPYSISNVLWMYPFSVLLISVIFLAIPQILGWTSSDPQNIEQISMTTGEYITNLLTLPLLVFEEESLNVLIVIAIARLICVRMKRGWSLLAVLLAACLFGFLHVSAWGWESAISRMFIHIPFIYSIIYFRTAWISMLAHFYQNALTYTSIIYPDFPTLFVGYGLLACLLIVVYRKWRKKVNT